MLGGQRGSAGPGRGGNETALLPRPASPPRGNIQADTDVTVERSARLFMEQVRRERADVNENNDGGSQQMRVDGCRLRPDAPVPGGETRWALPTRTPHERQRAS